MTATSLLNDYRPTPGSLDGPPIPHRVPLVRLTFTKGVELWTLAALTLSTLALTGWNLFGSPRYTEDEGTYASQALAVPHGQFSQYFYWYDHPPFGWAQMFPIMWLTERINHSATVVQSARVSGVVALALSMVAMYVIARRLDVNRLVTIGAFGFFLLSPLTQGNFRTVYIDNIAVPWVLLAFAVCVAPGRHRWNYGLAGMAMGAAALSKETALLLVPAVLLAVWTFAKENERFTAMLSNLAGTVGVSLLYPLYAWHKGQTSNLVSTAKWQLFKRAGSGSIFDSTSDRRVIVHRWFETDVRFLVAGLVASIIVLLFIRRMRFVGLAALLPLVQVIRTGGYMPSMLITICLPFFALAIAGVVTVVWDRAVARSEFIGHALTFGMTVGLGALLFVQTTNPVFNANRTSNVDAAMAWTNANLPKNVTILADDTVFAQLNHEGRSDVWHQAVQVYKLDTDPTAAIELPNGWRDIDYVVATPTFWGSLADKALLPQANKATDNSVVVAEFGDVTVRRVTK